tara:strand:+ start:164 stop:862 length:699 start_codon:yes stop_codon:yes gene_type:complete
MKSLKKDYKKMVKILSYDKNRYRFTQEVEKIFDVSDLSKLHKVRSEMFPNYKLGFHNEVKTDYHKRFYSVLNDGSKNSELKESYSLFISEVVGELIGGSFCYQSFPSFRVHLPGKKAVNKWHYDSDKDHMHPEWEINFQLALTDSSETQAMWIESVPGLGDFHPVNLKKDQFAIFYGNKCRHGNKPNETDLTRVSMDFRVLPIDRYDPTKNKSSAEKGTKFVIGGYYKLFER